MEISLTSYISKFSEAKKWTDHHYDQSMNYDLLIDENKNINVEKVVEAIAKDFSDFIRDSDWLPGRCFRIVREISYVLFELKIKHTVTIGDIELKDGKYVNITRKDLIEEIRAGYQIDFNEQGVPIGKTANAHCWITLENGLIIDATILASQNRKNNDYKPLPFKEAIYYSGKKDTPVVKYIPLITGFAYHYLVLTHEMDGSFDTYMHWYRDFDHVIDRLETVVINNG